MTNAISFSSIVRIHPVPERPPRWLDCPRKSTIIDDTFLAFKTPLDERYNEGVLPSKRWTCKMLLNYMEADKKQLGLIIDLTNTDRYYKNEVEFPDHIRYEKLPCQGHAETPNDEQIDHFIHICNDFLRNHPNSIIGVHCTHGFNRTGFLICAYLCRERHYSIDVAIDMFAKHRSPGIYKQDYLDEIGRKFGNGTNRSILAPQRPEWCLENKRSREDAVDGPEKKRLREADKSLPKFAVHLSYVEPVSFQSDLDNVRSTCQVMCEWHGRGFPGSQPVSMDQTNHSLILLSPYMVSWKADGTRYMMLIKDANQIYMLDRNNDVFRVHHLHFPKDANCNEHLVNTLVDGEFVIDNDNGKKIHRYLIYDVISYNSENVSQKSFHDRLNIIRHAIVHVRNQAIANGLIDKNGEAFSIREKGFYDLSATSKLLSPQFQSQITHGSDGLIFQPVSEPYRPGRAVRVLKWKDNNTIDFRLKISRKRGSQEKEALLYVNHMTGPYTCMPYSSKLDLYDNQIIECSYRYGQWEFYRHRSDKTYPNAKATADGVMTAIERPITQEILCNLIDENIAFNNS